MPSTKKIYDEAAIWADQRWLTKLLIERGLYITTMESATSGQIASLITDTEKASGIMKVAFMTYSNEAKIRQGVPAEVIETCSVYSWETAWAMAEAVRQTYAANIGMGVTGNHRQRGSANAHASTPGQVYFAISMDREVQDFYVELTPQLTRLAYELAVSKEVYAALMRILL